jgi:putative addiction module killer protein
MEVIHYITETGADPYQSWVDNIRDAKAKVMILRRVDRAADGNYGDCKPCREGVSELRIDQGPGYRVYFFLHGSQLVVLLCGGDKRTQDADIKKAVAFKSDFLKRMKEGSI